MRIGIDLGGTKIEAIAIDGDGTIKQRLRVATPQGNYTATLEAIKKLVSTIEKNLPSGDPCSVGVGIPGAISIASGKIKNANSVCLIGQDLQADLASVLHRPVRLANDADCFALSEATDGAAKGNEVVFGVILGTGVGGGIVNHGRLIHGPNSITGEWGHNPLPWPNPDELPGPKCYCGKHGCNETFLSGPGLSNSYFIKTALKLDARTIVQRASHGDTAAQQVMEQYEDRLARGLAAVINILDPHAIVLGGGLSNIKRLYKNVPVKLTKYVFSDRVDTLLTKAQHGDSSGVRGAAWLWPDNSGTINN
ncbi:MAG: ROK family protein [Magnetococcales bacterium]|nr:ROK family protein [Magnetococcales bacterium]